MATAAGNPNSAKQGAGAGSFFAVLIAVVLLSVIAAGGGGFLGLKLYAMVEASVQSKVEAAEKAKKPVIKAPVVEGAQIKLLAPIVTNLVDSNSWVRLEASIVLNGVPPTEADLLAAKVSEDILAFLRTVSLSEIEGASGFQHLREDLTDRIKARSSGQARELVIHTFVVE